jgi:glycosyltransferase involved in cell wall biosynthesis
VTRKPALFSPHPLFSNFGEKLPKERACEFLEIDPAYSYSLFFGLIRDYKGLDLLLDAWAQLKAEGRAARQRLIIAGEFYNNKGKYLDQIGALGLLDDIVLHDYFIPDDRVRWFFSAADCLILPYRSATQSGVTQIAYHFQVPIIVTCVGGLAEIVPDDAVGYVCEVSAPSLAHAMERMREPGNIERFAANMEHEKKRFSWEAMADRTEELYGLVLR